MLSGASPVFLIIGSTTPVIYYGFGESHQYKRIGYLCAIVMLGLAVVICSVQCFDNPYAKRAGIHGRLLLFIALALSGVGALVHAMVLHDYSERTVALFHGVLFMGAMYFAGVGFYASHLPEALAPRRFDLLGSSHNLWHLCIFAAAVIHYQTIYTLWEETAAMEADFKEQFAEVVLHVECQTPLTRQASEVHAV